MNNKQMIPFLIMSMVTMVMMYFMLGKMNQPAQVVAPKPQAMIEQAMQMEEAAGGDKKKLNQAIKVYKQVAKENPETELAATARLRVGIIQETGVKNEFAAVEEYSSLLRDFPPEKYEQGREAKAHLEKIDAKNAGTVYYKVIDFLVKLTGSNPAYSYALALLIITIVFKVLTTPLSHLQFKYMKEMQKIQPLVKQLQEKYKDNQKEMGEKLMALYKEHGVNPFSSCLPLLVQFPVLLLLYKMVRVYQAQFVEGNFLWIGSALAQKYSFIAANLALPDIPLLIIYTISMIVSQRLMVVDPTQAQQQKMMAYTMPLVFAFIFWRFPAAFMLYWLFFNIVSTVQQYYILKPKADSTPPTDGTTTGGEEGPIQMPGKPKSGSSKAKKRRRRFDARALPRPVVNT